MDLLKNWLSSTVEQELDTALQKAKAYGNLSMAQNVPYEDDGSNLRVTSSKSGVIQIIKFTSLENPIQAHISDSTTRIQATIAVSAVRKYEEDTNKRFTEGTLGGLFQILDFEIVATHLGPRPSRLTLLIKKFKSIGSNGSGTFGMPQAIEQKPEISLLLKKLSVFRTLQPSGSEVQSGPDDSTRDSSIFSQVEPNISDDSAFSNSQAPFATQVTRPFIKKKDKKVPLDPSTNSQPKVQTTAAAAAIISAQKTSRLGNEVHVVDTVHLLDNAPVKATKATVLGEFRQPPGSRSTGGEPSISALKVASNASALLGLLVRSRQPRQNSKPDSTHKEDTPGLVPSDETKNEASPIVLPNNQTVADNQTPVVNDTGVSSSQRLDEMRKNPITKTVSSVALEMGEPQPSIATQATIKNTLILPEIAPSAISVQPDGPQGSNPGEPQLEQFLGVLEKDQNLHPHSIGSDSESLCTVHLPDATRALPEHKSSLIVASVAVAVSEMLAVPTEHPENKEAEVPQHLPLVEFIDDGRKRRKIGRRAVVIPKDQTYLSGRSDSWLPAEPGERRPTQNVPTKLLTNLNMKADFRASQSKLPQETAQSENSVDERQESPTIALESEHDDKQDSEADLLITSSDWPTSPSQHTFEQLPPDSSAEVEEYTSEKMARSRLDSSEVEANAKGASPSQGFADLALPAETRSRNYKPSARTCPGSQTSTTSLHPADSSTGEESTRFSCPAPGCIKTYRNRKCLKYHTERHHRSKRSQEVIDNGKIDSQKELSQSLETRIDRDVVCDNHITNIESIDNDKGHSPYSMPLCSQQGSYEDVGCGLGDGHQSPEKNFMLGVQHEVCESIGQGEVNPRLITQMNYSPTEPSVAASTDPSTFSCLEHVSQSQYGTQSLIAQDPKISHTDLNTASENILQTPLVEDSALLPCDNPALTNSDSEIEVEIPSARRQNTLVALEAQRQGYPTTRSQSEEPSLQVKGTPYSHALDNRVNLFRNATSTSPSNMNGRLPEEPFRSIVDVEWTQSSPIIRSQSYRSGLSNSKSYRFLNRPVSAAETEVDHSGVIPKDISIMARRLQFNSDTSSQNSQHSAAIKPQQDPDPKEQVNQATQPQIMRFENVETKRKAPMTDLLSPNVTKRRKHFKRPTGFDFSQDRSAVQDPIVLGRTYRQEFLAYRKNSMPTPTNKPDLCPQPDRFADPFGENDGRPQTAPMSQIMPAQPTPSEVHINTATSKSSASVSMTADLVPQSFGNANAMTPKSYDEAEIIPSVEGGNVGKMLSNPSHPMRLQADEDATMESDSAGSQEKQETFIPNADPSHSGDTTHEEDWGNEGAAALVRRSSSSARSTVESPKSVGALRHSKAPASPYVFESDRTENASSPQASSEKSKLQSIDVTNQVLQLTADHHQEGCQRILLANETEPAQHETRSLYTTPVDRIGQAVTGATIPEECLYTDLLDIDISSVVLKDSQVSLSADLSAQEPTKLRELSPQHHHMTGPARVFAQFKANYLDYTGDMRHFVAICKKINTLVRANRMIPKFLWDDFIVRHKLDYPLYLQDCNELAEDPMPYEQFYHERIIGLKYMGKVINSRSLGDVLELDTSGGADNPSQERALPSKKSLEKGETSFPTEPSAKQSLIEESPQSQKSLHSTSRIMIDLTADKPEVIESPPIVSPFISSPPPTSHRIPLPTQEPRTKAPLPRTSVASKVLINSEKKAQRSLPWTEAGSPKARLSSFGKPTTNRRSPLSSLSSTPSRASASQSHKLQINPSGPKATSQNPPSKLYPAPPSISKPSHQHNRLQNTHQSPSKPSRSRPSPELDTAAETLATLPADEWYKDDHTPFKDFARAYTSIQPGKGNSYAQPGVPPKERRERKEPRKLDIWNWKLD